MMILLWIISIAIQCGLADCQQRQWPVHVTTACYGLTSTFLYASCEIGKHIVVKNVYANAKPRYTNCPEQSELGTSIDPNCCICSPEDCQMEYSGVSKMNYYTECNGKQRCFPRVSWQPIGNMCSGRTFLLRSNYMVLEYYCVSDQNINPEFFNNGKNMGKNKDSKQPTLSRRATTISPVSRVTITSYLSTPSYNIFNTNNQNIPPANSQGNNSHPDDLNNGLTNNPNSDTTQNTESNSKSTNPNQIGNSDTQNSDKPNFAKNPQNNPSVNMNKELNESRSPSFQNGSINPNIEATTYNYTTPRGFTTLKFPNNYSSGKSTESPNIPTSTTISFGFSFVPPVAGMGSNKLPNSVAGKPNVDTNYINNGANEPVSSTTKPFLLSTQYHNMSRTPSFLANNPTSTTKPLNRNNVSDVSSNDSQNNPITNPNNNVSENPSKVFGNPNNVSNHPNNLYWNSINVTDNLNKVSGNRKNVSDIPNKVSGNSKNVSSNNSPISVSDHPNKVSNNPNNVSGNSKSVSDNHVSVSDYPKNISGSTNNFNNGNNSSDTNITNIPSYNSNESFNNTEKTTNISETHLNVSKNPNKVFGKPDNRDNATGNVNNAADNPIIVSDIPNNVSENPNTMSDNPNNVSDNPSNVSYNPNNVSYNPNNVSDNPRNIFENRKNISDNPNSRVSYPYRPQYPFLAINSNARNSSSGVMPLGSESSNTTDTIVVVDNNSNKTANLFPENDHPNFNSTNVTQSLGPHRNSTDSDSYGNDTRNFTYFPSVLGPSLKGAASKIPTPSCLVTTQCFTSIIIRVIGKTQCPFNLTVLDDVGKSWYPCRFNGTAVDTHSSVLLLYEEGEVVTEEPWLQFISSDHFTDVVLTCRGKLPVYETINKCSDNKMATTTSNNVDANEEILPGLVNWEVALIGIALFFVLTLISIVIWLAYTRKRKREEAGSRFRFPGYNPKSNVIRSEARLETPTNVTVRDQNAGVDIRALPRRIAVDSLLPTIVPEQTMPKSRLSSYAYDEDISYSDGRTSIPHRSHRPSFDRDEVTSVH